MNDWPDTPIPVDEQALYDWMDQRSNDVVAEELATRYVIVERRAQAAEGDVARLTEENERLRAGIEALTERFWKGWKANGWSSPSGALLAPTSEEVDRG
jgi:hypothetical protein